MELIQVIIAGITGTILMTAFSFIMARVKSQQFKEPKLLNMLLRRSTFDQRAHADNSLLGWVLHFAIGIILMILFYILHLTFSFNITFLSIISYGIFAGILAILSWHIMFLISSPPPDISLKEFYIQLLIAHILFALGAFILIL